MNTTPLMAILDKIFQIVDVLVIISALISVIVIFINIRKQKIKFVKPLLITNLILMLVTTISFVFASSCRLLDPPLIYIVYKKLLFVSRRIVFISWIILVCLYARGNKNNEEEK